MNEKGYGNIQWFNLFDIEYWRLIECKMWIVFQVDVTPANLLPTSLSSLPTLMPHLQSLSLQSHCAITEYQHIKHLRINFKNISTSKILSCRLYTAHTINMHNGRVVCFVLNFLQIFLKASFQSIEISESPLHWPHQEFSSSSNFSFHLILYYVSNLLQRVQ